MTIVIIEDEIKTAKALAKAIQSVEETAIVQATLQSVSAAIDYFTTRPMPDLIFMDVQLSDGLCFDIFKETNITCPVIFCTAYDEYAIEGFKANGIDYILKPFSADTLKKTFEKIGSLKDFFQQDRSTGSFPDNTFLPIGKKSFLVFKNNRYTAIPTENIAFFFIKNELPALRTFDGKEYFINQSLDAIGTQLPARQFYRVTRQYLINFTAVKEVENYFSRKLLVHLIEPTTEKIILNKNNTTAFLHWLDNR